MKIECGNGNGYVRQTIRQYDTGTYYTRFRSSNGTWNAWMTYPTRAEINALNSKITEYTALTSTTHTIVGRYMKIGYLIIVSGNFTYKSGVFNVETNLPAPYSAVPFVIRNSTTGSMGTAFFESNHLSTYLTSATLNDGNTVRFTFSYIANQV